MAKDVDLADFQHPSNPLEATLEPFNEASNEAARSSLEVREPKSAKELAAEYKVSDRAFQDWFKTVCTAYVWVALSDLKTGNSNKTRYTVLCQDLIAQYRDASKILSADDWIKAIHESNRDKFQILEGVEAELVEEYKPPFADSSAIALRPSTSTIAVHQINQIHLTVINTQPQVDQALANLQSTLSQWNQNNNNLESALVQNAENQGSELGAKVAIAKVSKLVQTSEQVEQALAAQLGLLGKPQTAPAAPQDS